MPPSDHAAAPRAWVLLAAEAIARGFGSRKHPTLAFRRWCRSHGVTIRTDDGGRLEWVRVADVDAAIAGAPGAEPAAVNDVATEARAAVARYVGGGSG